MLSNVVASTRMHHEERVRATLRDQAAPVAHRIHVANQ